MMHPVLRGGARGPREPGLFAVSGLRRPHSANLSVFVRSAAPHRGLSSSAVSSIERRAMQRTEIVGDGLLAAYLCLHLRATHRLRDGASLEAVGALLRHQSMKTTAF